MGSVAGFIAGGGGGALVAVATGGVGTPAVPAGAYVGAGVGAAAGLATGKAITNALFSDSEGSGGTSGADPAQVARDWLAETNRANPGLNRSLSQWFSEGGQLPKEITREYLERYRTAAQDAIRRGIDKSGVQADRVRQIDEALRQMQ